MNEYDLASTTDDDDDAPVADGDEQTSTAGELRIEGYDVVSDEKVRLNPVILVPARSAPNA